MYFGSSVISTLASDAPINLAIGGTTADGKSIEDDFFIKVKDDKGEVVKIPISLNLDKASVQDKNKALQTAIKKALEDNAQTKDLVDSGQINIGLINDGKSLVFNDQRGLEVEVGGAKAAELGFVKTKSDQEDLLKGTAGIASGQIKGTINFNGQAINLGAITATGNSSDANAQAIVKAINGIQGLHASLGTDGKLILNSESGELRITVWGPMVKRL